MSAGKPREYVRTQWAAIFLGILMVAFNIGPVTSALRTGFDPMAYLNTVFLLVGVMVLALKGDLARWGR